MKKGKMIEVLLILQLLLLNLYACDTTEIISEQKATIMVEDIACTEAWIRIKTENISLPVDALLKIDGISKPIRIIQPDSTLFIDSLTPNREYKIELFIKDKKSNELTLRTMNTTSHDFIWQIYKFGDDYGDFRDCVVLSPDNIWCVGEFLLNDSLGNVDPQPYNVAHWDGLKWETKKIYYSDFAAPISAIWALNQDNIWLGTGYLINWNGNEFREVEIPNWHIWIRKIWGSTSNDIYVAGDDGRIVHYSGSGWQEIVTGTETQINDIWGIIDYNNEKKIYCAVSGTGGISQPDKKILVIEKGNKVRTLENSERIVTSVWTDNGRFLMKSGDGIFNNKSGKWVEEPSLSHENAFTYQIKGNARNDLFTCGNYGLLAHYNGQTWKRYYEISQQVSYSALFSVTMNGDIVTAVGNTGNKGLIIVGKRN